MRLEQVAILLIVVASVALGMLRIAFSDEIQRQPWLLVANSILLIGLALAAVRLVGP